MPEEIDLFMWGYQAIYAHSVHYNAERLFGRLSTELEVETFVVGFLREGEVNDNSVCIQPPPQKDGYTTSLFSQVREDAKSFLKLDGQENMMATHPGHHQSIQNRRHAEAFRKAVIKALSSRWFGHDEGRDYYFSGCTPVGQYDVGIIAIITAPTENSLYRLPRSHSEERYRVPDSLVSAVAEQFLKNFIRALYVPNPETADPMITIEDNEILRKAGDRLMEAPNFATGAWEGLYGLFSACNFIASLNYEGAESRGGLILSHSEHPNIEYTVKFQTPIPLREYRRIRKLLELTSSGLSLISDGVQVFGLGQVSGNYDQSQADLMVVRFLGHHKWQFLHAEHAMMIVTYGLPDLPRHPLDKRVFRETYEIVFDKEFCDGGIDLYKLALEACKQRHGTVLVVSPHAKAEAERLAKQASLIEPVEMTEALLRQMSTIDGALLMNLNKTCYAIGAILDGIASDAGDPGRGARFNSSHRYIQTLGERNIPVICIVVSEDGTSEIVPSLPHKISRDEMAKKIEQIDSLEIEDQDTRLKAQRLLSWFNKYRFYIDSQTCDKLNKLNNAYFDYPLEVGCGKVHYSPFSSSPEMSNRYFIERTDAS